MKKQKPSTKNTYVKQQQKHIKRIKQFIKSAKQRGYIFSTKEITQELAIPPDFTEFSAPKTVKNPTKVTINRLAKINPDYLYNRAIYVDPETGEIFTGKQGRFIERSRASRKGRQKKEEPDAPPEPANLAILETVRDYIKTLQTVAGGRPDLSEYKRIIGNYMLEMFDDIVQAEEMSGDIYEYSAYLESRAEELNHIIETAGVASDRSLIDLNVTGFMAIINRGALSAEQVDNLTDYTEAMGYGGGMFY